jgi:hypothetical protein
MAHRIAGTPGIEPFSPRAGDAGGGCRGDTVANREELPKGRSRLMQKETE